MHLLLNLLLFSIFCNISVPQKVEEKVVILPRFKVEYEWSLVNFTWKSEDSYNNAVKTHKYIPQNNIITGIKFYKEKIYLAMPRFCQGSPVTLGYISTKDNVSPKNRLITPFPDWKTNDLTDHTCDKLESVESMEIDPDGIMWVLDGHRQSPVSKGPPKLVLYNLNTSNPVHTFIFPEQISLSKGGYLNDIVVDKTDGDYAYITESSNIDPGLIVYSRAQNRAWKLRDASMFPEIPASNFVVDGVVFSELSPIDGIALTPRKPGKQRYVFYTALTGLSLYSISTDILKDEDLVSKDGWRRNVTYEGKKRAPCDGMIIDNESNLYYGLLPLDAIAKWNTWTYFLSAEILYQNKNTLVFIDSFSFDNKGSLYVISNRYTKFAQSNCHGNVSDEIKIRILKGYTGTVSYFH